MNSWLVRWIGVCVAMAMAWLPVALAAADLRLRSFNIDHGEGLDGKLDPDRIGTFVSFDQEEPGKLAQDWTATITGEGTALAEWRDTLAAQRVN